MRPGLFSDLRDAMTPSDPPPSPTLAEQIEALARESSNSQVTAMLLHAAQLEAAAPVWKTARVRIKKRGCATCVKGVLFEGQNPVDDQAPSD